MNEQLVDRAFVISLWIKGLDGLVEVIAGVPLLLFSARNIHRFTNFLVQGELGERKHEVIANFIFNLGHQAGTAHIYVAFYLLAHGLVKLVLVWYLLKGNMKAYPWALGVLSLFALYQAHLAWQHPTWFLIAVTLFDVLIVYLVWQEYQNKTAKKAASVEPAA